MIGDHNDKIDDRDDKIDDHNDKIDDRDDNISVGELPNDLYVREEGETDYRLLAFDTASPYVWEYRGAPKRFYFRVAYRGARERDIGTPSPEEAVTLGG